LRLGSVAASLDEVRDHRTFAFLSGALMDLRQAWIALRRKPGYFFLAGGALATAVAVNTLVFTILYGVLLRPLPYPAPERLVRVFEDSRATPKFPLSIYHYQENMRLAQSLQGLALYSAGDLQLTHENRAEPVTAVAITEQFFPLLGGMPERGRNFRAEEMLRASRVVILSHSFWTTRFRADESILGKTLRLNRENWTVVGIAPAGFEHVGGSYRSPLQGDTVAMWRPLPQDIPNVRNLRSAHYTNAIARLKDGVNIEGARQELNRILADLAKRYPESYSDRSVAVEPLDKEVTGKSRGTVVAISSAGGIVLLLATINVAGLAIARTLARRRELAVRTALGGGRWRILRAVVSENVVLALFAGAAGLAATAALLPLLRMILPQDFPRLHEIVFRWPSALFALEAAVGTSLAAGFFAALPHTSSDPSEALHEDSRGSTGGHLSIRLRGSLVAVQTALACVLLFASALLLRSTLSLGDRDHGFDPANTLTFVLSLPARDYNDSQMATFYAEAGRRLREIPGVRAAGFSTSVPWTGYDDNTGFGIVGMTPPRGEQFEARYQAASPGFMEAIGTRLIKGRAISNADNSTAPKVVVINEALAHRYFPNVDPLSQTLEIWGTRRQIVGVIADIRDRPADVDTKPAYWTPLEQQPFARIVASIRAQGDPSAMLPAARAVLTDLDPELALTDVRYLSTIADAAMAERRFTLLWSETFASMALALAAIGLYALLAYSVQQRHREIGIRLALGATRATILRMVLAGGLLLAASGIAVGALFTPLVGRAVESLLYGVAPTDTTALLAAPLIILAITLIACLVPAYSAVRTEPMSVLREQ
jgi:predicted permease